jgi:hypothetical protein
MANRTTTTQSLHDKVINTAKDYLNQKDYDIYTNPNGFKNAGIGDNYPDIIMTKKGTSTVEFIIEVETEDSVDFSEADSQWKKYATEIKASFYILVPLNKKQVAIDLCRQVGISARFGTYKATTQGMISDISFE